MIKRRIPKEDFEKYVPSNLGTQVRINHVECTAGTDTKRRLYIRALNDGAVVAFCHNCGFSGYIPVKGSKRLKISEIKEILDTHDIHDSTPVEFPYDANGIVSEWPAKAAAWLYKYRLTDADISNYDIKYSPSMERVILPGWHSSLAPITVWQARDITGMTPAKYITKRNSLYKGYTYFPTSAVASGVFIVEDLLSSYRLHMAGANVICTLGTHMSDECKKFIVDNFSRVGVYYDADPAGIEGTKKIVQALKTYGVSVAAIYDAQPKEKSKENLKKLVVAL